MPPPPPPTPKTVKEKDTEPVSMYSPLMLQIVWCVYAPVNESSETKPTSFYPFQIVTFP